MSDYSSDELEAVQNVLDRVSSYQDGAPEGTVAKELREALDEAGIDLEDGEIAKLAEAIERDEGAVEASAVLG